MNIYFLLLQIIITLSLVQKSPCKLLNRENDSNMTTYPAWQAEWYIKKSQHNQKGYFYTTMIQLKSFSLVKFSTCSYFLVMQI